MEINYAHIQDLSENLTGLIQGTEFRTDTGLQSYTSHICKVSPNIHVTQKSL